jgi:hypothetical protein
MNVSHPMHDNPDTWTRLNEIVPFAIALVLGALGGCGVAMHHAVKYKRGEWLFSVVLAYAIVGACGSVLGVALLFISAPAWIDTLSELVLVGLICGVCSAGGLLSANLIMRVVLKQLGIDVQITVRRDDG